MSDKIILKACLNGGRGRDQNPNVPWTPEEVAAEAKRCYEAGASIVHIHARAADGRGTHDAAWYAEADQLIRARAPLLINHTTIRRLGEPIEVVLNHLSEAPPDMCSLMMGHLIRYEGPPGRRKTAMTPNSYEDMAAILETCYARGIVAEPGLFDLGMWNTTMTLIRDGVLRHTHYFFLELPNEEWGSARPHAPGTPQSYLRLREQVRAQFPNAVCLSHGLSDNVFRMAALAIAMGDGVRIGMEDWLWRPDGTPVDSSADLVEWAVTIARACGRDPATPAEARTLLIEPVG